MGDRQPSISVLIPVYNVEQYLRRCLDSILGQSFGDFEVVCVNDASPDSSLDILKEYADHDKRIKIIDKPVNEGPMLARHTAYSPASGQYFFFCDSDDYLPTDALQALYDAAEASGADLTIGDMCLVNTNGKKIYRPRSQKCGMTSESYLRSILHWNSPSLCGTLFNRRLFDDKNYTAKTSQVFSEDRILLTEILLSKDVSIQPVPKTTYYYWINDASATRRKPSARDVQVQFSGLFQCYDYVEKHAPHLHSDNIGLIIRYLSLYLEKGVPASLLCKIDPRVESLLSFTEIKRCIGTRLAVHTTLCINLPGYRATMHGIRGIIRKLQGKD